MEKTIIGIIGLGYIGLPIAISFSKKFKVVGFDINKNRINSLNKGIDLNKEEKFNHKKKSILFTEKINQLKNCNFYIVCVPTPIKKNKDPDLNCLKKACNTLGKVIDKGNIVVFESTVYPGTTEGICATLIEKSSGIKCNKVGNKTKHKNGFYIGYSPERINPGDKKRKLENIDKLISSPTNYSLNKIYTTYKSVIKAKLHKYDSIKICEAAKIIENVQRDVNIALINELTLIFSKLNLNIYDILDAASTKWNFIKFKPGLVGGHCIGIDPYYLSYLSKKNGMNPKLVLSGRSINDKMYLHIFKRIKYILKEKNLSLNNKKILIMGYSFKENCADVRNTQVRKLLNTFLKNNNKIQVFDPLAFNSLNQIERRLFIHNPKKNYYDIIIITVSHKIFKSMGKDLIKSFGIKNAVILDVKNIFNKYFYSP